MKESDLFDPVKDLFESLGYKINAEVLDCDITATKDNELVIIELKRNLSVTLLAQGLERQKADAKVYIAIPKPKKYSPKKYRETLYVIKKLELGLVFVTIKEDGELAYAEIVQEPEEFFPVRVRKKQKSKILKEIDGRSLDTNKGGVSKKKIITAFTEKNIFAACIIEQLGKASPKQVKQIIGSDCGGLLSRNYYQWFNRIEKGIYTITDKCKLELMDYSQLTEYYRNKLRQI